jgi:hypothetical protein
MLFLIILPMPKKISSELPIPPGESRPPASWHDVLPKNKFWCLCYKALCMIAVSKSSVDHWRYLTERPIKKEWLAHREMVINRFENMNVTVRYRLCASSIILTYLVTGGPGKFLKTFSKMWLTSLHRFWRQALFSYLLILASHLCSVTKDYESPNLSVIPSIWTSYALRKRKHLFLIFRRH